MGRSQKNSCCLKNGSNQNRFRVKVFCFGCYWRRCCCCCCRCMGFRSERSQPFVVDVDVDSCVLKKKISFLKVQLSRSPLSARVSSERKKERTTVPCYHQCRNFVGRTRFRNRSAFVRTVEKVDWYEKEKTEQSVSFEYLSQPLRVAADGWFLINRMQQIIILLLQFLWRP